MRTGNKLDSNKSASHLKGSIHRHYLLSMKYKLHKWKMKWHARIEVQDYSIPDSKTMCTFRKKKKNDCACEATFQMPPWTLAWFDVIMTYHQGDLAIVMSSAAHFSVKYGHTNRNRMQQGGQKAKK